MHQRNNAARRFAHPAACAACLGLLALAAAPAHAQRGAELHTLVPSPSPGSEGFGRSVAIGGELVLVGARGESDGSAYFFNATTGELVYTLAKSRYDASARFGTSVAVDGGRALIGAPDDGLRTMGAYLVDLATGQELARLVDPPGRPNSADLGFSVALEGGTALLGGSNYSGGNLGGALIFDVPSGTLRHRLLSPRREGSFGSAVALAEGRAVVGDYSDEQRGTNSGAVFVFDSQTGAQLFELAPDDPQPLAQFGWSVAASGKVAIVGSTGVSAAYLFDLSTGEQLFKLTANDVPLLTGFGWSVAIHGDRALVGAVAASGVSPGSGAAYLFDVTTGQQLAKLFPSTPAPQTLNFGRAVALSHNRAIVTDIGGDGTAYIFNIVPEPSTPTLIGAALIGIPYFRRPLHRSVR